MILRPLRPLRPLSLVAQSAYIDLRSLLLDDQVAGLVGTVERKERNGRVYLYERFRAGDRSKSRYLGEAAPELESRIANAKVLQARAALGATEKSRLARLLRAEGMMPLDQTAGPVVATLARLGAFRLGATLVGTMAFRLYEGELGYRFGTDLLAQTGALDIASFERLSIALGDEVTEPIAQALRSLSFEPLPAINNRHTWRWRDHARALSVEFLTPAFGQEVLKPLPALGVSAQGLNYLNYLIAGPIKAAALYRSGVLVQIPRPERYALHKLIVATRRRDGDRLKSEKDRAQAAFLIGLLARDRPDDLAEAWAEARANGPRWRERLDQSLARMTESRVLLDSMSKG